MDLIDRYVHEVGQRLPLRMRADVEAELRSLLAEALEERARAAGHPPDRQLEEGTLREFGAPQEVAARYAPEPRYLIGPGLFPAYVLTLEIAGIAVVGVFLLLAVLGVIEAAHRSGGAPGPFSLFRIAGHTLHGALFNLGVLTLVFAVVERVQWRRGVTAQAWDPATLRPVDDPDQVSALNMIFSTYAIVALVVLFNFFPQWVGFWAFSDGRWSGLPILLPEFSRHLPLLNLWWALAFVLDLIVLRHGRWRRGTRWARLALGALGAIVLIVIVTGPRVFAFDHAVKSFLAVPLLIAVVVTVGRFYRLLTRRPPEPWED
jgi:hypothetical protein